MPSGASPEARTVLSCAPEAVVAPIQMQDSNATGFFSRERLAIIWKAAAFRSEHDKIPTASQSRRFNFPLRLKLALSFSLLLLILSGVVALSLIRYEKVFLKRETQKRVRSLAESLAASARDPILATDQLFVGSAVETAMLDEDVRYSYVVNHLGRVVYHSEPDRIGEVFPEGRRPAADIDVVEAARPITAEGVQVGMAVVGLGLDHINKALNATLAGMLVPLVVSTALGIVGIFLLSGLHLQKIENLVGAVDEVGRGNLRVRVTSSSSDEVGQLAHSFNLMVRRVEESQNALEKNFKETIGALAAAVEARDPYTRGHCDRVARLSRALGKRLRLDEETLDELELAAILHDVGKIGTEERVLGKEGKLLENERGEIEMHPVIGARILEPISFLERAGEYVRHHHENYDGSGYPDGLAGAAIPIPARIIALVDAYDAMTTDRSYRRALSRKEALKRILDASGTQFDPALVDEFVELDRDGLVERICAEVDSGRV